MPSHFLPKKQKNTIPIIPVTEKSLKEWLKKQGNFAKTWLKSTGFTGKSGQKALLPAEKDGKLACVLVGVSPDHDLYSFADLPLALPASDGGYCLEGAYNPQKLQDYALGWGLGCYQFDTYTKASKQPAKLVWPTSASQKKTDIALEALKLVRDLINTPTNDMGPAELAAAARKLARSFRASCSVIAGNDLLKKNYPLIHAVGKASSEAPRLIDLKWGKTSHPKVTLVGKGVCFDTGGLDIKPSNAMSLMKKDMGGAAHVLGLAHMIMAAKLPVRLRVLVPAVENAISGNAFRPGDIIKSRKGITVEIGDTDAEGRLVLADALTEACREKPELVIDFATLTGAARVALGPDLPPLFSNNDKLASDILKAAEDVQDPVWRLPLWKNYRSQLSSSAADTSNITSNGMAGAITAALFLEKFVDAKIPWAHFDTYGWNLSSRPGRPVGGEAYGVRAVFEALKKRYT